MTASKRSLLLGTHKSTRRRQRERRERKRERGRESAPVVTLDGQDLTKKKSVLVKKECFCEESVFWMLCSVV